MLIVDDDTDNMEAFVLYLRTVGHDATGTESGEDALQLCAQLRPEVVLLDLGLRGIDGHETCRRLRAGGCRALIVALTGYASAEDRRLSAEAGFDQHLVKPVAPTALAALVAAAPLLP